MQSRLLTSLDFARVAVSSLKGYLRFNGWTEYSDAAYYSVWVSESAELVVPTKDSPDYRSLIRDAVDELSDYEGRPQNRIFEEITNFGYDLIKVSTYGKGYRDGTVELSKGDELFRNARELLLSAACSSVNPKPVYKARKPAEANRYLHQARLGQTEYGSYVITILSPVCFTSSGERANGSLFEDGVGDPFPRKVVKTLASASTFVRDAAKARSDGATSSLDEFEKRVESGVSANRCDAISGLLLLPETEGVNLNFSWSKAGGDEQNVPSLVDFSSRYQGVIAEAAENFRRKSSLNDYSIEGYIVKLERAVLNESGRVTIRGFVEDRDRNITVTLGIVDYALAAEAHTDGSPVKVIADLHEEGRGMAGRNPRAFSLANPRSIFD